MSQVDNLGAVAAAKYMISQVFGDSEHVERIHEEDIISVLKFDTTGKNLAIGDHAGRVIVFNQEEEEGEKEISFEFLENSFEKENLSESEESSFRKSKIDSTKIPYGYFT